MSNPEHALRKTISLRDRRNPQHFLPQYANSESKCDIDVDVISTEHLYVRKAIET